MNTKRSTRSICVAIGAAALALGFCTVANADTFPGQLELSQKTQRALLDRGRVITSETLKNGRTALFATNRVSGSKSRFFTVPKGFELSSMSAWNGRVGIVYSREAHRGVIGKLIPHGSSVALTMRADGSNKRALARGVTYSEPKFICGRAVEFIQMNTDGSQLVGSRFEGQPSSNKRHRCILTKHNHMDADVPVWELGRYSRGKMTRQFRARTEEDSPWNPDELWSRNSISPDGWEMAFGQGGKPHVYSFRTGNTADFTVPAPNSLVRILLAGSGRVVTLEKQCAVLTSCGFQFAIYPNAVSPSTPTVLATSKNLAYAGRICGENLVAAWSTENSFFLTRLDASATIPFYTPPEGLFYLGVSCDASSALISLHRYSPTLSQWARVPF